MIHNSQKPIQRLNAVHEISMALLQAAVDRLVPVKGPDPQGPAR